MVSTTLMRIMSPCWRPSVVEGENSNRAGDSSGRVDGLLWYKYLGNHVNGEFSMAVIQANNLLEDHSQLESGPLSLLELGPNGTFVGVYDGHGGPEASRLVNDHLFKNLKKFTSENQRMSAEAVTKAFLATEEEFLSLVRKQWLIKPLVASVGACCLVGIVCSGLLYIANAGDSRAVLGRMEKTVKQERNELVKGSYRDRHFNAGSILLTFRVLKVVGGGVNTWFRTGKLFPGPHLFAGAGITVIWAATAALVPTTQKGNETARSLRIALNTINVLLFIWRIPTGLDIVWKVFELGKWP